MSVGLPLALTWQLAEQKAEKGGGFADVGRILIDFSSSFLFGGGRRVPHSLPQLISRHRGIPIFELAIRTYFVRLQDAIAGTTRNFLVLEVINLRRYKTYYEEGREKERPCVDIFWRSFVRMAGEKRSFLSSKKTYAEGWLWENAEKTKKLHGWACRRRPRSIPEKRQTEFFLQRCWWAGACVAAVFICSPFWEVEEGSVVVAVEKTIDAFPTTSTIWFLEGIRWP